MFVFFMCVFICRLGIYFFFGKLYFLKGFDSFVKKGWINFYFVRIILKLLFYMFFKNLGNIF